MATFAHDVLHTYRKFQKKFVANIHNGSTYMSAARRHGAVKQQQISGRDIVRTALVAETGNIGHFKGKQRIQHTAEEPFEGHKYDWHWMWAKLALAETDIQINSGSEKIMDLVGNEVKRVNLDLRNRINMTGLKLKSEYASTYNVSTSLLGFGLPDIVFVANAGTTVGQNTLGGNDRSASAFSWFRNQGQLVGANIGFDLQKLFMNSTRNGTKPALAFCGPKAYRIIADAEEAKKHGIQNVIRSGRKAPKFSAGYDGILFNGMELMWDHDLTEDTTIGNTNATTQGVIYFVSTEHWYVIEGLPWNYKMMDWDKPTGGSEVFARESTILHSYTHYHDMPRTCGVGFQIATS